MPKPPMNDEITLYRPKLDALGKPIKDGRGNPLMEAVTSDARVQYRSQIVEGERGMRHASFLEVDLPPETVVLYGTELHWVDRFQQTVKGLIVSFDEQLNYSDTKVYFRTAYVGNRIEQ